MNDSINYTRINNRRYLGNKYRILPFIQNVINTECGNFNSFADIFAGTGVVSSAFTNKTLFTNDILYSNFLCHITWFSPETFEQVLKVDCLLQLVTLNLFQGLILQYFKRCRNKFGMTYIRLLKLPLSIQKKSKSYPKLFL